MVALNLKDCINCVKSFYDVGTITSQADVFIVMQEVYREDSAMIVEKFYLGTLNVPILWSDSLFDQYSINGASSISLESKYATERIVYPMLHIPVFFFDYIKTASKEVDTLFTGHGALAKGVEEFLFFGSKLAMHVNYKQEVLVYDLVSGKQVQKIGISDSLLRVTFVYSGLPPEQFEAMHNAMLAARVPELFRIEDLVYSHDTLIVQLNN